MSPNHDPTPDAAPAVGPDPARPAGRRLRLAAILGLALVLRLIGLGWGIPGPTHGIYHPDELDGIRGAYALLNDPRHLYATDFVATIGAGYFYAGAAALGAAERLGLVPPDLERPIEDPGLMRRVFVVLRLVTVAFSLGTVALVFLVGRRLFGPRAAELAALLEAVSPIAAVNAHFIKTDSPEAFGVMLTLFLTVAAARDRRWLAGAMFTAGMAAAFKYPGVSAVIFPLAGAALFHPEDRARRLRTVALALPLVAVGFALSFPDAVLEPMVLVYGVAGEAGRKLTPDGTAPLRQIALYPFRLMQAGGAVLPAWAWAAMAFGLWRRRRESLLLLAWLLPYLLIMSSSAVAFVRYAVPMMPVMALLMAAMAEELAAMRPRRAGLVRAGALVGAAAVLLVTMVHLRTMMRSDPREEAGVWVRLNIPMGRVVAVTPSHRNDGFFIVPVEPARYRQVMLDFRPGQDVSGYFDQPFDYLATNEQAWRPRPDRHPSQAAFWAELDGSLRWSRVAEFHNRPAWPGVLLRGSLPEDMYYLYQATRVYRRE